MKNTKRLVGLAAAVLVVGSTAGCTASAGGADGDGEVTVTILSGTIVEQPDGEVEQAIADAYMAENPNVTIEFIGVPSNELQPKLIAMASSGTLPDIFFNSPDFAPKSVDLGAPADLNEVLGAEFVSGFAESGIEQATIDDAMVFAPWYSIPTGLIYRADWFDEAGLTPPATWDEFTEVAQDLTGDTDGDGETDRWGVALLGSADLSGAGRFVPILRSFGATELEVADDGWETAYDSPEAEAAFQLYGDLVNKYEVTPVGTLSTSYPEAVNLMSSDTTAMMVSGSNAIGAIMAQNPDLDGKLAAVPLPHAPGHKPAANLGLGGYSISETSQNKEVAADYLKFLLNDENQVKWSDATGRLPMRTGALEQITDAGGSLAGFVDAIPYGYAPPQATFYPAVLLAGTEAYQSVILEQSTAGESGAEAARVTREEIDNAR
ncbi:ABC transporter substrate-binding protein [Microbacterium sp. AK031]|uniref:ABC transporter substrate-binding protein n=1 Tax=Microbacterium sp. AK031 TaxID=2723076 RepID=UPI002168D67E|nr:sugar ABC transporter substrate-binding protein [Microbacterium sp. AK031]MCS3844130.1 ABC-type glycerol-3-phosphate transport system substrate-binding protein [Microbacterium sp. AK031]